MDFLGVKNVAKQMRYFCEYPREALQLLLCNLSRQTGKRKSPAVACRCETTWLGEPVKPRPSGLTTNVVSLESESGRSYTGGTQLRYNKKSTKSGHLPGRLDFIRRSTWKLSWDSDLYEGDGRRLDVPVASIINSGAECTILSVDIKAAIAFSLTSTLKMVWKTCAIDKAKKQPFLLLSN